MSTNVLSLRTRPFGRPSGGGLRNHKISQKFIGHHIFSSDLTVNIGNIWPEGRASKTMDIAVAQ